MTLQAYQLACTRGDRELFHNINFAIKPGDALRLVGANGCGKTSMLRVLCGLSSPVEGAVRWNGQIISKIREDFARQLLYLGHANGVKDDLLAWENVVISAVLSGQVITRDDAYAALDDFGLHEAVDLPTRALSQGQRKRVALARLHFGLNAPLWILDEPFNALDTAANAWLTRLIESQLKNAGIVVLTSHQDMPIAALSQLDLAL